MTKNDEDAQGTAADIRSQDGSEAAVMLVVSGTRLGKEGQPSKGVFHSMFHDLDAGLFDRIKPTLIVSPLVSTVFDAMDVARILHEVGYQGEYRAVTFSLPDAKVVMAEVDAVAPGLNFDIFQIADN